MALGSIIIDLLMRTGSFETDTDRATKAAEKRFKALKKEAEQAGAAIGTAFAAAGAAAVFFGKQVIDGLDALNDVADATGASVENISALEDVAIRTGTTLDNVSGIMVKFNNALKEADGKNGVSQALKAIGLDAAALKQLDPAEALRQAAVALAAFADDGNKARIVQELFGKSIKDAAPFLKDLAEQGELNAKVTADQTQAAEDFNKQLFSMQKNVVDAARAITSDYLPALNDILTTFNQKGLKSALDTFGNLAFDWEGNAQRKQLKLLQSDIESLGKELAGAQKPFAERLFGASGLGYITADASSIAAELDAKVAEFKKVQAAYYKLDSSAGAGRGKVNPAFVETRESVGQLPVEDKDADKRLAAYERYLDGLNKQLEKTRDLTTVEQVLTDIQLGRVEGVTKAQKEQLLDLARQVDLGKEAEKQKKSEEESAKRVAAAQKQLSDEIRGLYESTRTPLEKFNTQQQRLNELLTDGKIDADLYTRAMAQADETLAAASANATKALEEMSEASKRAEQNIQDALGDSLEDALGGNFDNIGKSWLNLLNKMVAQALAADVLDKLMGRGSGTSNRDALWGGVSSLFSAWTGSSYVHTPQTMPPGVTPPGLEELATGTNYIPYDGFVASLHEGEAVVPKVYNPAAGGGGGREAFDFSGAVYNIGQGVNRGEMEAAVRAGNMQVMAQIERSQKQRYGA